MRKTPKSSESLKNIVKCDRQRQYQLLVCMCVFFSSAICHSHDDKSELFFILFTWCHYFLLSSIMCTFHGTSSSTIRRYFAAVIRSFVSSSHLVSLLCWFFRFVMLWVFLIFGNFSHSHHSINSMLHRHLVFVRVAKKKKQNSFHFLRWPKTNVFFPLNSQTNNYTETRREIWRRMKVTLFAGSDDAHVWKKRPRQFDQQNETKKKRMRRTKSTSTERHAKSGKQLM